MVSMVLCSSPGSISTAWGVSPADDSAAKSGAACSGATLRSLTSTLFDAGFTSAGKRSAAMPRPTSTEYEATADRIQRETGAAPVHPYDDARTIAGQGTCALELLEQAPDLDFVIAPVGGGGLLSGTAITVKSLAPKTTVLGAEPEMANDALLSLRAGTIVPQTRPRTVADGLRTSLGALTFPLIREHVDDIVTVSESSILAAMRTVWEVLKIVIEPSSAVAIAPLLEGGVPQARGKRIGIILSGGNVDLDSFPLFSSKGAVANEAR